MESFKKNDVSKKKSEIEVEKGLILNYAISKFTLKNLKLKS